MTKTIGQMAKIIGQTAKAMGHIAKITGQMTKTIGQMTRWRKPQAEIASSDYGQFMSQMAWNADQMGLGQGGRCLEPDQNQTKVLRTYMLSRYHTF